MVVAMIFGSLFAAVAYAMNRLIRGAFQVPWRWLGRICLVAALVAVVVWLPRRYPPEEFLNPILPDLFSRGFWLWVYVLALGSLFSLVKLVRSFRAAQAATESEADESATRDPEVDAAWREIRSR